MTNSQVQKISTFPFQLASQLDFEDSDIDLSPAPAPTLLSDHADSQAGGDIPPSVNASTVSKAFEFSDEPVGGIQPIATTWAAPSNSTRVVRYEIPAVHRGLLRPHLYGPGDCWSL